MQEHLDKKETTVPLGKVQTAMIVIGLLLGILLEAIDSTLVNNSLRKIVSNLGGTPQMLSWVVASYMLTMTMTTPLYGRLSDIYGKMPFYLAGMAIFMLGSILSGFSQTMIQLICFRALQGLGAGAMMPIAVAIGQTLFPAEQRGKFQGAISGAFALAAIFGPVLGGVITEKLSWHWLFYLNLPFGILATIILYRNLPEKVRKSPLRSSDERLDIWGAITLALFAMSLMLFFTLEGESSSSWNSIAPLFFLGLAIISLISFLWIEKTVKSPLIPFVVFRNREFLLSAICVFISGGMMFSVVIYIPLYYQYVIHMSSSQSGGYVTPMMISMVVGSLLAGRSLGRWLTRYKFLAVSASFLVTCSLLLLGLIQKDISPLQIAARTCLFGFSIGITFPLYSIVVAHYAEKRYLGVSFGLLAFFRHIGSTLFVSVFGGIFGYRLKNSLDLQISKILSNANSKIPPFGIQELMGGEQSRHEFILRLQRSGYSIDQINALFKAIHHAMNEVIPFMFYLTAGLGILFLIANLFLPDKSISLKKVN